MSFVIQKRFTITLGILCFGLLILIGWLFWNYGLLQVQVALAAEQTQIFEEMRVKALHSSVTDAAGCLQYVVNYYPSGTKQPTGSCLDQIVERERKQAAGEIINYLQIKTEENFGENPEIWIAKFAPK